MSATRCLSCQRTLPEHWDYPDECPGFRGPWLYDAQLQIRDDERRKAAVVVGLMFWSGALLIAYLALAAPI